MKRGDVVMIVAVGDLGKPRPAIVVQADDLGDETKTIIVCPMSSEIGEAAGIRPSVDPTPSNGLRVRSQIMTDKVIALSRHRIRGELGQLDEPAQDELDRALLIVLGLAR